MAKGSRGGQRANTSLSGGGNIQPTINAQQIQQGQQTQTLQVDDTQQAQTMSAQYDAFMQMSDDEKADIIDSMIKQGVPVHLADNDFQKMIYNIGLNDKPQLVDDATLDSMNGTELFRTVNNVYDRRNDISYTADQIARQVQAGRVTRVSDNGGSVYGRGIYFADNKSDSTLYGNTRGNVQKTAQIRCKLNNNAKVINHSKARRGVNAEIRSGSKLGKVLSRCDYDSKVSIYAMAKGYNVITSGHGYYNILNRNAVTMSKTISSI